MFFIPNMTCFSRFLYLSRGGSNMIKSCLWGSSIISSGPKTTSFQSDFSILTIPLLCTLKSLWVNHGVVPKNQWFHITGTPADSHTVLQLLKTTDDLGDQARPGAELAAKKRLFCHVLHQAGGSPGHPNEGSLELAPTGDSVPMCWRNSRSRPSLSGRPMGRTLLDLGPGIGTWNEQRKKSEVFFLCIPLTKWQ